MDRIVVRGGTRLAGEVTVSGSKNSALALMCAALLAEGETRLRNVPRLRDIEAMLDLLRALGARAEWAGDHEMCIDGSSISNPEAPYELVRKMRASFMVLGPLLARFGSARVSEPGGCAIGVRPIDQHLKGLRALGAKVRLDHGVVEATTSGLCGGRVVFDLNTVNGTQNVMMASVLASGETVLENAAREPEVVELADVLSRMGADVRGAGGDRITIRGVSALRGIEHQVSGDRIEAGTLLCAGLATRGDVTVTGIDTSSLESTLDKLQEAGATLTTEPSRVRAEVGGGRLCEVQAVTAPFPGFPTDMQAQLMALVCTAEGSSVITERVFENRFMHVPELQRMGADISLAGRAAHVRGVPRLGGAPVMATDLRASAGLIVAALAAEGDTTVNRVYHIDRGYERIEEKLRGLGAEIRREG
ncbi:MAG: UDP-N-acetylglucosamine 1-carboxyvinyltransferase [Deltaproteobacteria bacterium]|nr:UDP-N-acetylglucosamine 1-carboxyvinyltransferase [Deltaproteobacteria bacterium]MBW2361805.1 UDP-N-acetylglucosamine 1-carboxyvinyltransferase [Deltaproteobacteria bacterium]